MSDSLTKLGTAALPAAVLDAITTCAEVCRKTLRHLEDEHDQLRSAMSRRIRSAPDGPTRCLCAVDGSHATVATAGATFTALAAVAVEDATLTDQEVMVQLLPPVEEIEGILGGLRCVLELRLLARRIRATSSGLFVLDGSFYSVLMEINRLLMRYAQDHRHGHPPAWWDNFRPMLEAFFVEEDWRQVLDSRRVIAHSKSATSIEDVIQFAPHLSGTVTDRSLWSSILLAGEYSLPVSLVREDRPHLLTGYRNSLLHHVNIREYCVTIEHCYGQLYVLYYRPDSVGPAYRLELPAALIAREPLGAVLATFRGALRVNSVQEPLPQFLADAICCQLQRALAATVEGARTRLQHEFDLALVHRYLGPYRTPRYAAGWQGEDGW